MEKHTPLVQVKPIKMWIGHPNSRERTQNNQAFPGSPCTVHCPRHQDALRLVCKTLVDALVFAQNAMLKGKREIQENRETAKGFHNTWSLLCPRPEQRPNSLQCALIPDAAFLIHDYCFT